MSKFGCRRVNWMDWFGNGKETATSALTHLDQLCLYSLERGGTLTIASDVKSGQPVIDSLRVGRPCHGLHVYHNSETELPMLMLLDDCSQLSLWKKSELVNLDVIREAIEEKANVIVPPTGENRDQVISSIYKANYEEASSDWPTFLQVPELRSLSSAARHLLKQYDNQGEGLLSTQNPSNDTLQKDTGATVASTDLKHDLATGYTPLDENVSEEDFSSQLFRDDMQ